MPTPDPTDASANADAPAPKPPEEPKVDVGALQAELAKTKEQFAQVQAALAAIQQAEQPAPQQAPEPEVTPEFRQQASAFFKQELAPFLQEMRHQMAAAQGWQAGQQLQQRAAALNLPAEVQGEAQKLMDQYAHAGRPISHETALRQVLGMHEEARLLQAAANAKAKAQFNTSLMPTFGGGGGLPNLQPLNGERPADNDINAWARLAEANDLPLN